jgi:hypothetical protein
MDCKAEVFSYTDGNNHFKQRIQLGHFGLARISIAHRRMQIYLEVFMTVVLYGEKDIDWGPRIPNRRSPAKHVSMEAEYLKQSHAPKTDFQTMKAGRKEK